MFPVLHDINESVCSRFSNILRNRLPNATAEADKAITSLKAPEGVLVKLCDNAIKFSGNAGSNR